MSNYTRESESGDAEVHVNKMHELFQKLLALGTEIKPEFFMYGTLLAILLPSSYDALVTTLLEGKDVREGKSINKRVYASKNNFKI